MADSLSRRLVELEVARRAEVDERCGAVVRAWILARLAARVDGGPAEDGTAIACRVLRCGPAEAARRMAAWYKTLPADLRARVEHARRIGKPAETDADPGTRGEPQPCP